MRKIKVLLLLHELSQTGSPKVALDVFASFGDWVDLRILSLDGGPLEARARRLGPVELVNHPAQRKYLPHLGKRTLRHLISLSLSRWQPDLIYINSLPSLHITRSVALPEAPTLLHVHELDVSFELVTGDDTAPFAGIKKFIAVSKPVRDLLVARNGVAPDDICVANAFVRDEEFHCPRPTSGTSDECLVIGGAGKPDWRKGTALWLQAAAELRRLLPHRPFRFVWVGVGRNYESICFREEARKLGVLDLVEFVPVTPEPYPHFARFDVFAMTSWEDPCPLVVLENMMLGTPVVCFGKGGGAPEEVGDTGVVVPEFDPAAMAREIASLASDAARRSRLGAAARARVGRQFLASSQTPKIEAAIRSLAGTKRHSILNR